MGLHASRCASAVAILLSSGCGGVAATSPPAIVPAWCADGQVATERLPASVEAAWLVGDSTGVLAAADGVWTAVADEMPGLFHPDAASSPVANDVVSPEPAAPADVGEREEVSDDEHAERVARASELRAWIRTYRDVARPVVDVGLDRFIPAPDLAEAAVEAAFATGDAAALDSWSVRIDRGGELMACVARVTASDVVP